MASARRRGVGGAWAQGGLCASARDGLGVGRPRRGGVGGAAARMVSARRRRDGAGWPRRGGGGGAAARMASARRRRDGAGWPRRGGVGGAAARMASARRRHGGAGWPRRVGGAAARDGLGVGRPRRGGVGGAAARMASPRRQRGGAGWPRRRTASARRRRGGVGWPRRVGARWLWSCAPFGVESEDDVVVANAHREGAVQAEHDFINEGQDPPQYCQPEPEYQCRSSRRPIPAACARGRPHRHAKHPKELEVDGRRRAPGGRGCDAEGRRTFDGRGGSDQPPGRSGCSATCLADRTAVSTDAGQTQASQAAMLRRAKPQCLSGCSMMAFWASLTQ